LRAGNALRSELAPTQRLKPTTKMPAADTRWPALSYLKGLPCLMDRGGGSYFAL